MRLLSAIRWSIVLLVGTVLFASGHDAPFATRIVSMEYPRLAAMARISGTAVIQVRLDSTGKVLSAKGLSGHPILIKAAEANIKLWRFSTGGSTREKPASEFELTYVFELTGGSDTSRPCSGLTYEYPGKVKIVSEAPHWEP